MPRPVATPTRRCRGRRRNLLWRCDIYRSVESLEPEPQVGNQGLCLALPCMRVLDVLPLLGHGHDGLQVTFLRGGQGFDGVLKLPLDVCPLSRDAVELPLGCGDLRWSMRWDRVGRDGLRNAGLLHLCTSCSFASRLAAAKVSAFFTCLARAGTPSRTACTHHTGNHGCSQPRSARAGAAC
jgi:hypothetical protein